ncbi:D-glycero-beta-D-manno-heptose 1,7-bisphosphate 7-phosphatase [Leeia sp.]|uniref:D-glycero-beta-D-manno-heptose 1,7-bisphosphate 7-phosphatase n=1 Tax=Leeia sp. TaxID=2884678 RepID=UPI0035AE3290
MKLLILDRDGVLNHDRDDFVKSPEEWIPLPGSLEAVAAACQAGWTVAVATNQSGIGRGLFDLATLQAMHDKLQRLLQPLGGRIDLITFCPHGPDAACDCRKPKDGLFRQIMQHYGLADLNGVPAVGDSLRDLQAGQALGTRPWLVRTGKGERTLAKGGLPEGTRIEPDLQAVVQRLLMEE